MKITYWIKLVFLLFSWFLLFDGLNNDVINSKIFFASVLIYSGAIVFDLIFLCIDTNAKVGKLMTGIYFSSLGLTIINAFICLVEFVGAIGGLKIGQNEEKKLIIEIAQNGLTKVFPNLLCINMEISIGMLIVLGMGLLSIFPGLLMTRLRRLKQVQS